MYYNNVLSVTQNCYGKHITVNIEHYVGSFLRRFTSVSETVAKSVTRYCYKSILVLQSVSINLFFFFTGFKMFITNVSILKRMSTPK